MKQKSLISVILTVFISFSSVFCVHAEESGEKIRVMPLGDSITDGFSTVGGYRQPLCNKLEENGYSGNFDFVGPNWGGNCYDPQHAGYSGYSIDNIDQADSISGARTGLSSFIDWLMDAYPADVVMLQIGTNDILSYYDLENIGTRLEKFVDTVLTYIPDDGMLFLATIPCMDANNTLYINEYYFTPESMDECVDAYNTEIKRIAAEKQAEGKNIRLADINSVLTKSDLYDGVHPTEAGYKLMADYWYDILVNYLNGTEKPQPTELATEETSEPATEFPTEPETTEPVTEPPTEQDTTEPPTESYPTEQETTNPPGVYVKGDANYDGKLSVADIVFMNECLTCKREMPDVNFAVSDMNGNGQLDVFDAVLLRRMLLV